MPTEFERRMAATIESICEQARTLATHEGGLPEKEVKRLARPEGVVPILKRYQALHESWEWDENSALRSIADWSEAQEERYEGSHRTMAPLSYFQGPEEEISLGEGITIRPFTDADREALWHSFGEDRLSPGVLQSWTHAIDCRWERSPSETLFSHGLGMELVNDVVRALRLQHPGMVETTIVWTCPYPPDERGGFFHRSLMTSSADRRFDSAIDAHRFEHADGRSELSYRAALRIALLAADDGSARREAFRQARLSYNSRSQVVHGEAVKAGLEIVVEQTRELARKVLRAWVLNPPSGGDRGDRSVAVRIEAFGDATIRGSAGPARVRSAQRDCGNSGMT